MTTPILDIPEIANNQVDQYITANEAFRALESAANAFLIVNLSAGNVTLTDPQFTRSALFRSTGNTVARILTVPASVRKFDVENGGSASLTIKCGTTELVIDAGAASSFYTDGTANGLKLIAGGMGGGGGGITNWTESKSTSSPNATIPVVAFEPNDAATNLDASIIPKGTGAFILAIPNSLTSGGNKRGSRAVDLQTNRTSASQVASGSSSFCAGSSNEAGGSSSVCVGRSNSVNSSASDSHAYGDTNTISQASSFALGTSNNITGSGSLASGHSNTISGNSSYTFGFFNSVLSSRSYGFGTQSGVPTSQGKSAYASGQFSSVGDAQLGKMVLRRSTTNSTPSTLSSDGTAQSAANQLTLPNSSAYTVQGKIIARQNTTGDTASWKFDCCIKRGASAAATAMVAACTPVLIAADAGASAWVVTVTANTTHGGLNVEVTGEASKTIRWVCTLESAEVSG